MAARDWADEDTKDDGSITWDAALSGQHSAFSAALGVRAENGSMPMMPVYSKPLKDARIRGFEAYYAPFPGREFVIKLKEVMPSFEHEYGCYIYIDQGSRPPSNAWNHYTWFGHHERDFFGSQWMPCGNAPKYGQPLTNPGLAAALRGIKWPRKPSLHPRHFAPRCTSFLNSTNKLTCFGPI